MADCLKLQQRHFNIIATVLRASRNEPWDETVHRFADALAATNGRFNRDRFLDACGYRPPVLSLTRRGGSDVAG